MDLLQTVTGTVEPQFVVFRETAAGFGLPLPGWLYRKSRSRGDGHGDGPNLHIHVRFPAEREAEQTQIVADPAVDLLDAELAAEVEKTLNEVADAAAEDPEVAEARGVPVRAINMVFAVLVGLAAAQAVQVVGALLVLSLLITPAAAAAAVTSSPGRAIGLTILFAEIAAVGGMLLSLAPGVPVSVFVTTISFVIYLACRVVAAVRR